MRTWEKNTFGYRLEMMNRIIPNRTAIIQGEKRYTFREMNGRINALINAFLDLGVKKGDRVAYMLYNCNESMETQYAVFKMGAVAVNVNATYLGDEILYLLQNSGAKVLVLDEDAVERVKKIRSDAKTVEQYIVVGKKVPDDMLGYDDLLMKYPTKLELPWDVKSKDLCFLYYTGGTTGLPKGAMFTQEARMVGMEKTLIEVLVTHNFDTIADAPKEAIETIGTEVVERAISPILPIPGIGRLIGSILDNNIVRQALKSSLVQEIAKRLVEPIFASPAILMYLMGGGLKSLVPVPLYHAAGWQIAFLFTDLWGTTDLFPASGKFDPKETWELCEKEKPWYIVSIGDATAKPLAEELEKSYQEGRPYDTSSLFIFGGGGAPFSPKWKNMLIRRMPGTFIVDTIGSTETPLTVGKMSTASDKPEKVEKITLKVNPKDRFFPIRVVDPYTREDIKPGSGEVGTMCYGSKYLFSGYWNDPEKTEKVFFEKDGKRWFDLGDMVTVDEDGYIHFLGRGSEVIVTGGEKVYAEEVETAIETYPKVAHAGVFGIPDERWGEAVTAGVELKPGEKASEEEIIDHIKGKLARYKNPKRVFFFDKLPLTSTAKVLRRKAKEMVIDRMREEKK